MIHIPVNVGQVRSDQIRSLYRSHRSFRELRYFVQSPTGLIYPTPSGMRTRFMPLLLQHSISRTDRIISDQRTDHTDNLPPSRQSAYHLPQVPLSQCTRFPSPCTRGSCSCQSCVTFRAHHTAAQTTPIVTTDLHHLDEFFHGSAPSVQVSTWPENTGPERPLHVPGAVAYGVWWRWQNYSDLECGTTNLQQQNGHEKKVLTLPGAGQITYR